MSKHFTNYGSVKIVLKEIKVKSRNYMQKKSPPEHKELKCCTFCHRYSYKTGQKYVL